MKQLLKLTYILSFLTFCTVLSGCATIVHGTNEKFNVASTPTHASILIDGTRVGTTPKQIKLSRSDNHTMTLSLAGYQPETIRLKKSISGWFFGNILLGGLVGIAVDAADGAMYSLTPEEVSYHAQKQGIDYIAKKHSITVFLVKRANKNWKKIGQLKKA